MNKNKATQSTFILMALIFSLAVIAGIVNILK
jgi:hypothetical protein